MLSFEILCAQEGQLDKENFGISKLITSVVSVGEIALKRRRLDLVDGKNCEYGLMSTKRILIVAHHASLSLLDSFPSCRGSSFRLF
jgi:hypothetical protein